MKRPSIDAVRGFDRAVYVVALGQLINVFGSGLVYPFATVHFHLEVGIALSVVGFGFGAKSVATAVGTGVGGFLADGVGRKPVMVASMALTALALAAFAFVPTVAAAVPPSVAAVAGVSRLGVGFVVVCVAAGLVVGLYTPAASAMTADLTADADRDRGYALLKFTNNLGFGAGLVVGGLVYSVASVAVFLFDGVTSAIVALVLLLFVPRLHGTRTDDAGSGATAGETTASTADSALSRWWAGATRRRVLALAAINVGFAAMYAQMRTTIPVVAKEGLGLSSAQLGTLFVLNPLTIALLQIPLVDAISGWRRTRGLALSAGLWGLSMLFAWAGDVGLAPVAVGVALVGGHLVVRTVGEILHSPLASSLMSSLGTADERGTHLSVLEIAKRVGMGLGAFLGGVFFDHGYSGLWWAILVAVCLLLVLALLGLERSVSPEANGERTGVATSAE
ncbi:MFS transporter [Halorarum halobium]|uniref:MFS transporter n=1 Tax=Halorarum halobium TaxID=3075121 RepID=UPI0028A67EE6|nr:MFS transporter [Halobaculum sp. XH14]